MGTPHLLGITFLVSLLLAVSSSASGCVMSCIPLPFSLPPAYIDLNTRSPVPITVITCTVNPCRHNSAELNTDAIERIVTQTIGDAGQFHIKINMFCNTATRLLNVKKSANATAIPRGVLLTSLTIHWCETSIDDLAALGNLLNIQRVSFYFTYPNGNLTESDYYSGNATTNHQPINEPSPSGVERITSYRFQSVGLDQLPRFLTDETKPLTYVHELAVRHANINSFPHEISLTLPNLQSLDLTGNKLTYPPYGFPWSNTSITLGRNLSSSTSLKCLLVHACSIPIANNVVHRNLRLDENQIRNLSSFRFHGQLHTLSLRNNRLRQIDETTFTSLSQIFIIDISDNELMNIPSGTFRGLSMLLSINLSRNKLRVIPDHLFTGLDNLIELNLKENKLIHLPVRVFTLPKLKLVFLQNNSIIDEDNSVKQIQNLDIKSQLSTVHLQYNKLTSVPVVIFYLPNLQEAFLFANNITFRGLIRTMEHINDVTLITIHWRQTRKKVISLQNNSIVDLSVPSPASNVLQTMSQVFKYFDIDIKNNGALCDCNAHPLHSFITKLYNETRDIDTFYKFYFTNWKCQAPLALDGTEILNVPDDRFLCDVSKMMRNCPLNCVCRQRALDQTVSVDCSGRNLTDLPVNVPSNTTSLIMSDNRLSHISARSYIINLHYFDLSNNALKTIGGDLISHFNYLLELDLRKNRLQEPPGGFSDKPNIRKLWIGQNSFTCDCHTMWISDWLFENDDVIADENDVICHPQLRPITEVDASEFTCAAPVGVIVSTTVAGLIVVIIILVIVLWVKYGMLIKVWTYSKFNWHPFDKEFYTDPDLKYDAFISYANEDCAWVLRQLRPQLEDHPLRYSVCLHDRDFVVGAAIIDNILRAIRLSKRMIVVLTPHYLKSEWCRFEFMRAFEKMMLDKSRYLIVVKMNDDVIEDCDLEELMTYMSTNTYLSLSSTWFWEKLFYVMPQISIHQNISTHHNLIHNSQLTLNGNDEIDNRNIIDHDSANVNQVQISSKHTFNDSILTSPSIDMGDSIIVTENSISIHDIDTDGSKCILDANLGNDNLKHVQGEFSKPQMDVVQCTRL